MAHAPTGETDTLREEFRFSLRRVLRWAEAYEPSREQRRAHDADLDEAEALLAKTDVGRAASAR